MSAPKVGSENSVTESLAQLGASLAARPYARRGVAMSNETIRVLLADDHAMVREGLRLLLRRAPDIAVIGEAENGVTAVALFGGAVVGRLPRASGPLSTTQSAPSSSTTTPYGLRRPQAKTSSVPTGSAGWKRSTAPLHGTAPGTTAPGSSATPKAW